MEELHLRESVTNTLLPTVERHCSNLPCISCSTLAEIIQGKYKHLFSGFLVVDCRFPYEYSGGHIKGSVSLHTTDGLDKFFFHGGINDLFPCVQEQNIAVIFHCEFSSQRAPSAFHVIRNKDRTLNMEQYPRLLFPHMYILDGGYNSFYTQYKALCSPTSYTPMRDPRYSSEMKAALSLIHSQRRTSNRPLAPTPIKLVFVNEPTEP
ncbi:M-phase inducer phosphatase 1 [Pelomyxa schiedti]|nr:M-phase inducer phosphatase 1 [Pelomyxa schiedti]